MKLFLTLFLAGLILVACEKDKFQTKPQIEIKSVSSDLVPVNGNLTVEFEFRDKEGDVDSMLYMLRHRLNQRHISSTVENPLLIEYKIPPFPDKSKGEIILNLEYVRALTFGNSAIDQPGSDEKEPDTLSLKFFVKDAKGNVSDTVSLGKNIVVIR